MGDAELFYRMSGNRLFYLRDKMSRSITDGVNHMRKFIMSADNKIRLHINKKCTGIIEDLYSYRYPEHKEGFAIKEQPLKDGLHDHGVDALRYGLVSHFPIRKYQIRKIAI